VHGRATNKHRLTTTWTWGKRPPPPLIILSMHGHGTSTQMSFCLGTPKLESRNSLNWDSRDFGNPRLWRPITLCANVRLKWSLKQSCIPPRDISNGMWHITYTQGNQGDSLLLMVRSQIDNLIHGPSFGPNLCFKCPNGSCKPISDIYILNFFNDIRKSSIKLVLTPKITL
jgi:hypothetical protein